MKFTTRDLLFTALISSLLLLTTILLKQQNSTNTQTLGLSDSKVKDTPPINTIKNKELSCSDCAAQGKDAICFNVETNRAYCGKENNSQNINVLCRKCSPSQPKPTAYANPTKIPEKCYYAQREEGKPTLICPSISPKPTCTPRPLCLDQEPRCEFKMEPIGGWCTKKPTITPQYCLQVTTPARNLTTKECKNFPTSCIPEGWSADQTCSTASTTNNNTQ